MLVPHNMTSAEIHAILYFSKRVEKKIDCTINTNILNQLIKCYTVNPSFRVDLHVLINQNNPITSTHKPLAIKVHQFSSTHL